jgi:CDP-glycerol glycerophosphotransferase (TagB/SpsB family)
MILEVIKKQFKNRNIKSILLKVIEVFYGYPLLFFSYLIPRDKDKILVGSHTPFNDNSKYFFIFSNNKKSKKRIIWIASTRIIAKDVINLGFESYYRWSIKGLYHSLTAKVYVFCFHVIDVNLWTSGNTVKFNLWHAVPVKHAEFNVKRGSSVNIYNPRNIISRIFALYIFIRPDFLLVTGKSQRDYFSNAFRLKDQSKIKAFGYPRCDLFFLDKNELVKHIQKYESKLESIITELKGFEKTYIYMPTWRDYDFFEESKFDFFKLNDTLQKSNSCFLLKLHPATKINLFEIKNFSNIKLLANNIDVYPLLPYTDCLITDYSSIYFDYLLLKGKEIKLFPFDKDKFTSEDRGVVDEYDNFMLSSKYYSFDKLLKSLSITEKLTCGNMYEKQIKQTWDNFTGNSTEKILYLLNTK